MGGSTSGDMGGTSAGNGNGKRTATGAAWVAAMAGNGRKLTAAAAFVQSFLNPESGVTMSGFGKPELSNYVLLTHV